MKTEIAKLLEERHLPEILKMKDGSEVTRENFPERRREMLDILAEYEYGTMPTPEGETTWKEEAKFDVCCGKASESRISITFPTPDGESFTFPVNLIVPKTATAENKLPAVVYLAFENKYYYPIEEVIDSGVIVAEVQYQQVSLDAAGTFDKLMDSHYFENGKRNGGDFGKIGMWAYAASRTLDFLLTLDYVDKSRVGVMGHSRLGKTALWAGANDERFTYIFSNDAGCSGDAIERGKIGERFPRIFTVLGYWFCENMKSVSESTDDAEKLPFDQHFLLACCAPRKLYITAASLDEWADPTSQYLSCAAASPAWELFGGKGFVHPDRLPKAGDRFPEGDLGFHLREGTHWLSRHDWMGFIDFLKK